MLSKHFSIILNCFIFIAIILLAESIGAQQDYIPSLGIVIYKDKLGAPNFSLNNLEGELKNLGDYRGKVILLNFWATWCPECKREMPSMETLYHDLKDKDFVVLAVSTDTQGAKVVKPFAQKFKLSFPILLDPHKKVNDTYWVRGYPTTFIIGKQGQLIGTTRGPRDWATNEAHSFFKSLLEK